MNEISKRIQNITEPLAERQGVTVTQGEVISANEKANMCDIKYTKRDGSLTTRRNVQIAITNNGVIDWFPEVGDAVLVQDRNGTVFITGPAYSEYDSVRKKTQPKKDFVADTFGSFFGGLVF